MGTGSGKKPRNTAESGQKSAAERFRTELRQRLTEMRENASRIGASSVYMESLDRSVNAVLVAIAASRPATADLPETVREASASVRRSTGMTTNDS